MEINLAQAVDIDAQLIMTGRGCAIGQSGSGKSFLAGIIAEELCKANLPFCIIDTEGEYNSLRSISDVIIAGGENGDVDLDIDFSRLFSASIENDLPVVLDLSDVMEKKETAYRALQALYDLESKARKPYLVIIEEADKFAPQAVSKNINIVEEISVRGRKRGIGLFITTQRPANVSKNVLSQCSYGFVGKLTIENDFKALKIMFNSPLTLSSITRLKVGEFISFGMGEDRTPFKVKPGTARRTVGTTPSLESYSSSGSKIASILRSLKASGIDDASGTLGKPKKASGLLSIRAIPVFFQPREAKALADKAAKRKFMLFGGASEKIDPIELKYLPLISFTLRFPTRRKGEYMEYSCLMDSKNELVRILNGIDALTLEREHKESRGNYQAYLDKGSQTVEIAKVSKDDIISDINEKRSRSYLSKFFPDATVVESKTIYVPIYRITFRNDNKVRVICIDGIYGKEVGIP